MRKYYIGDRIRLGFTMKEHQGTVITTKLSTSTPGLTIYGIELDEPEGLHSLNGMCRDGYGLWCGAHDVLLLKPTENRE